MGGRIHKSTSRRQLISPASRDPNIPYMVTYKERLSCTFSALADPTRREILAQLQCKDGASISELAKPFTIRLPAVMKHLTVLADAGLVARSKFGRTVTVWLQPQPMREPMEWLRCYERFRSGSVDRFATDDEHREAETPRKRR